MSQCSYCWDYGHNKRGCSKLKRDAQHDRNEGRSTWRVHYVDKVAKAYKERRCSYCKKPGHTRRTCMQLQTHKEQFVRANSLFRENFVQGLKGIGLGVGTLIRKHVSLFTDTGDRINAPEVFLVTSIDWQHVNFNSAIDDYCVCNWLNVRSLRAFSEHTGRLGHIEEKIKAPGQILRSQHRAASREGCLSLGYEIVSPVSSSCVTACMPGENWVATGYHLEMEDKEYEIDDFASLARLVNLRRSQTCDFDYLPELICI